MREIILWAKLQCMNEASVSLVLPLADRTLVLHSSVEPRHGGATLATNDQNKIKENFESNPSAQSSKEEVEKYNKVVNEMNKAAQASNTSTQN